MFLTFMENTKKKLGTLFSNMRQLRAADLFLCVFFALTALYGFFDITTSPQTYHLNGEDRTTSKVFLLAMVFWLVAYVLYEMFCLFFKDREKFFYWLKSNSLSFIGFALYLITFVLSSYLNSSLVDSFNTLIYSVLFALVFGAFGLYFLVPHDAKLLKYLLLFLFYYYLFFCLFYFFYVLGKPMTSGGLRVPAISHVFFCVAIFLPLRNCLNSRQRLFVLFTLFPVVVISDKFSCLIITCFFILFEAMSTSFFRHHKKGCISVILVCLLAGVLLIFVASLYPESALGQHFSFQSLFLGSLRLQNWTNILQSAKNFTFRDLLIGRGNGASMLVNNGLAAHNDYIDSFYNFGLSGLLSFCLIVLDRILNLFKRSEASFKVNQFECVAYVLVISFVSALFLNSSYFAAVAFAECNEGRKSYVKTGHAVIY